uniref:Uncharacterized protein n=1 Tax=Helianthus annuus TaxID=4232 RepID=A0A251SUM6_HELAN
MRFRKTDPTSTCNFETLTSSFPLSRRNIRTHCILITSTIITHQLHQLLLAVEKPILFLIQNIPKEIRQHGFITGHLSIPREIVDINNKVPIPNLRIPNNIEIEKMQFHRFTQPTRDITYQIHRRHCRILRIHHLIILIIIPLIRCQIRHLRKRQRTAQTLQLLVVDIRQ